MNKLWIARDYNNDLVVYYRKPIAVGEVFKSKSAGDYLYLPKSWFPEITFKNSPQRVRLEGE
jgi:hypothetical protein